MLFATMQMHLRNLYLHMTTLSFKCLTKFQITLDSSLSTFAHTDSQEGRIRA